MYSIERRDAFGTNDGVNESFNSHKNGIRACTVGLVTERTW